MDSLPANTDLDHTSNFVAHMSQGDWTLGVVGMGYVGLPMAVTAIERGLDAIGFDIDDDRVAALSRGVSHVQDVSSDQIRAGLDAETIKFTSDAAALAEADMIVIAVPSPLTRDRQPNLSYIKAAADTIESVLRPGQLISLESTTYPGTTEDYLLPVVERRGLVVDRDVWICFSPERVDPGNVLQTGQIPKVVGGVTPDSGRVASAAYSRLVDRVHLVSTARAAELTKLLENTYRAVNIALVNELAQFADAVDIDIWEVVDAAATKPFGYQPFYPGPGVGGHCIPLDPQYLAWKARSAKIATRFIDLAEDVNIHMPDYTARRVAEVLNDSGSAVRGAQVLAVGVTYKPNIADDRESPAWDVLKLLTKRGADISVLDPWVRDEDVQQRGYRRVTDIGGQGWDIAIILTDHDSFDYPGIADSVPAVFDTRGRYGRKGTADHHNVVSL